MPFDIALPSPYRSVEDVVHDLRPEEPVQALRPAVIASTAKWFLRNFPGEVMYAVKCNPDTRVLRILARAGVKHYDVASLAEVKLVAETLPGAKLYFMHPVKSRHAIRDAYFQYGVRDFSLDSHAELEKILEVTQGAEDLNLYVRLSVPNDEAVYSLSGKFGVKLDEAAALVLATREKARKLGVCFHVGSQCMNPEAYANTIAKVVALLAETQVKLDVLDVGGGFPSIYPGMTPPSLSSYMKVIRKSLKSHPSLEHAQVVCEPGRALVAEGASMIVQVDARKDNMLYINDGIYGSLFDAGIPGFIYPVKAIRPGGAFSQEVAEFGFFGPTCDSIDAMKGPFYLPADIREGDWIEIGQLGAYGQTMRTNFNGFYTDTTVEVMDKPLLSIFGIN
ncbi:MAG: type III PLP-dependent enzyme [Alphaproteobacteria bacterium]|nr:type III PLP-dependent enzyme [Alphaproteobacteria bacterium]